MYPSVRVLARVRTAGFECRSVHRLRKLPATHRHRDIPNRLNRRVDNHRMTEGSQQDTVVRGTWPELEVGYERMPACVHHAAASVNVGTMKKLRGVDIEITCHGGFLRAGSQSMDDSLAARRAWHMML